MTWSWQLTPSNAEVRNKFSYASTPPYALKACPFTFNITTTVQIGRHILITSKCSNPHSFTQALLSNPATQTAKLIDTPPFIKNLQRFHVSRANSCELIESRIFKWWVTGIMTDCSRNTNHATVFKCVVEFTAMSWSAYGTTISKGRRPQQLTIAVSRLKIKPRCTAGLRAYHARRSKPLVCTLHTLIFHITTSMNP
jgi:hypothetical protein